MQRSALALAAVLLVGTLGCSSDDSDDGAASSTTDAASASTDANSTESSEAATAPGSDLALDDEHVALGSSIAGGFGIPVQSTSCGRSDRNYPSLIAAQYELDLTDVSCGAATIPNVVDTAQGDNPPQISAVPEAALPSRSAGWRVSTHPTASPTTPPPSATEGCRG